MKKLILISLFVSVAFITATACQGAVVTFSFDENGNGSADGNTLTYGTGVSPVGGPATLYYVLTGIAPFVDGNVVKTGDVAGYEPESTDISDVLRFANVNIGGGLTEARVYVYSDYGVPDESPLDLADVGIPTLWYKSGGADFDPASVDEINYPTYNGFDWTPAGQTTDPTVTYHFISDVPEPATIVLLGLGGLLLHRRKR